MTTSANSYTMGSMSKASQSYRTPWDYLSEYFNTHLDNHQIEPDAAVNIHIGWPVFFSQIDTQVRYLDKPNLDILDFGCGTGSLCLQMSKKGHIVTGIDSSKEMITKARNNLPTAIQLLLSDHKSTLFQEDLRGKFDIITSMHVLDWIKDVKATFKNLTAALREDGILLFSVFPEDHIIDQLRIKDLFEGFDSEMKPRKGYANFNGIKVPVFVKQAVYYDKLAKELGLSKVLEYYPPYPATFLKEYTWTGSLYPEMLVLCYRKHKLQG